MHPSTPVLALLSPSDSLARTRRLRFWSTSQRSEVDAKLQALLTQWQSDWGLPTCGHASVATKLLNDSEARQTVQDQLFASGESTSPHSAGVNSASMAHVLADESWNDWLTRLSDVLKTAPDAAVSAVPSFQTGNAIRPASTWEGCIDITFPWWNGQWPLQLSYVTVQRLLDTHPEQNPTPSPLSSQALVPVTSALAAQPLNVSAEFSPVSLSLGQIEGLRVGDVIPLQQRLDEPVKLLIQTDATHTFCAAWLGQHAGRMAVELSALPLSS